MSVKLLDIYKKQRGNLYHEQCIKLGKFEIAYYKNVMEWITVYCNDHVVEQYYNLPMMNTDRFNMLKALFDDLIGD